MTLLYIMLNGAEVVDVVEVDDTEGETIPGMASALARELKEAGCPVDRYAVALRSRDTITMGLGAQKLPQRERGKAVEN